MVRRCCWVSRKGEWCPQLRRRSVEQLLEIGFPGYAIGGLSVGEDRVAMLEATELATSLLPADRLRYFMGIGDPDGLLDVIARGIDIFDCVLPTRTARMGTAFTSQGRLNLRNAEHALSVEPLEAGCPCTACTTFTRGAIRHFVMQKEILGLSLLTEHNLVHSDAPGERGPRGHRGGPLCRISSGAQGCVITYFSRGGGDTP